MRTSFQSIPRVLTVAGSDSSGGAGIQADLKTFTACGVYGASVVTALTAQNTTGVQSVHIPPVEIVEQQLDSVLSDINFSVIKTGMLPTVEIIEVCAKAISSYKINSVIVDPVLVATSGDALVSGDNCKQALILKLIPLATIVTPNLPEAEALTGKKIHSIHDIRQACMDIKAMGCEAVLLKGGHAQMIDVSSDVNQFSTMGTTGVVTDILYDGKSFQAFTKPRVDTKNTHGTGCTLASAIAAFVAKGKSLQDAVQFAKTYVYHGIVSSLDLGHGNGPLDHMHSIREKQNIS